MILWRDRPSATGERLMGGGGKCGVRLNKRKGESPVG
jgi:hypothetical protein